jgi:hypothetical protein
MTERRTTASRGSTFTECGRPAARCSRRRLHAASERVIVVSRTEPWPFRVPSCRRAQRALSNSVRPHRRIRCSVELWSVVRRMHSLQSCGQDPEAQAAGTPDLPWVRSLPLLWRQHHAPLGKQSGRTAGSRDADSSQYLRKWTLAHSMLPSFGMPVRTLSRSAPPSGRSSPRRRAAALNFEGGVMAALPSVSSSFPSDQEASHHQSSKPSLSESRPSQANRYFPFPVTMTRSSYGPAPFVETSAVADTSTISARVAERGRSSAAGLGCREVDRRCLAATRQLASATRAGYHGVAAVDHRR